MSDEKTTKAKAEKSKPKKAVRTWHFPLEKQHIEAPTLEEAVAKLNKKPSKED